MADIFISYSKQERDLTENVARVLTDNGYTVWWDTSLISGQNFREVILQQLDLAKAVVVIWTTTSVQSDWVISEATRAKKGRKLIPLRVRNVAVDSIPPPFDVLHTDEIDDPQLALAAILKCGIEPSNADLRAPKNIVIVDDHPLFRGAVGQALLGLEKHNISIIEANSVDELLGVLNSQPDQDLILLDLCMPGSDLFAGLKMLRSEYPLIPVVVFSSLDDDRTVTRCIELGAVGFVPKSHNVASVKDTVEIVLAGGRSIPDKFETTERAILDPASLRARLASLSPQQLKVLTWLADGLLNEEIAHKLRISEVSVKMHVSLILQTLDLDNRTQAVIAFKKLSQT